jgi:butyrate kinase
VPNVATSNQGQKVKSIFVRLSTALAAALVLASTPAFAQEPTTGYAVLCSKPEQVVLIGNIVANMGVEEAIEQVNKEGGDCAIATIVFIPGDDVAKGVAQGVPYVVKEVLVIGVVDASGVPHQVPPTKAYVPVTVPGQDA